MSHFLNRCIFLRVLTKCSCTAQHRTWPVMLFPVLKGLNECLRFAFVGPPVGNVWPQVAVTAGDTVLVGHDDRKA